MSSTHASDAPTVSPDPTLAGSSQAAELDRRLSRRASARRRRPTLALLISLLIHALLLSLSFGGQGLGLPGFSLPWQARRAEVPALRVVLVPPRIAAAAAPLPEDAAVESPVADGPALTPPLLPAPIMGRTATAIAPLRADRSADAAPPPMPGQDVIALAQPDKAAWVVPVTPAPPAPAPPPVIAAAPSASSPEAAMLPLRDAGDAARERINQEAARQEAARQEAVRTEAARLDAVRVEAARLEAERLEAARQAAARQEAVARQEAARQEAARVEAARLEAARLEGERQEATRQAARQEAARQDAARQETARADAARVADAQAEAEKREAKLRAIGRQLNEEADRRDAAAAAAAAAARLPSSALSPSSSSARRGRLFGRADANAELVLYAEAWSRKIQLNMAFDMVRESAKQPHTDPLVTVAVRSDGSVESVTFVRSSGVAAIDEAIRRIVQSQANYQPFTPALAREYDVVEIRRTWHFDMAIRLY